MENNRNPGYQVITNGVTNYMNMMAHVEIYHLEIQSVADYLYLEQTVKAYHDDVVSALLSLSHRNPKKYNLSAFRICHNREFVWTAGTDTITATKQDILAHYLGGSQAMAQREQAYHKDEINAFKRKIKKEGLWI